MLKRQLCRAAMVQDNIGHALIGGVPWNCHRGSGKRVRKVEIQSDDPLSASLQQQPRILLEELAIVPVNACNKEVISLTGAVLDSSNDG